MRAALGRSGMRICPHRRQRRSGRRGGERPVRRERRGARRPLAAAAGDLARLGLYARGGARGRARARPRAARGRAGGAALHVGIARRGIQARRRTVAAESLLPRVKLRGLYAITPEGGDVERRTRLALEGGIALLQYRQKKRDIALAHSIVRLAREFRVPVIINDDVELALELAPAAVHLARHDADLAAARKRLSGGLLGAPCHHAPQFAQSAPPTPPPFLSPSTPR